MTKLNTPEVQNTVIVKTLTEAANRVSWVPYPEIDAYFFRYSEMEPFLKDLIYKFDERETHMHDLGPRLVVRYRVYDNIGRTWRHGVYGDVALSLPQDIPMQMVDTYQPFYKDYFINLHKSAEPTHFAFLLVV